MIPTASPAARRARHLLAALPAVVLLAGCGDTEEVTGPDATSGPTQSITVNAASGFVYLALGDTARVVTVADPATSTTWDVGIFAFNTIVNSGAGGPGDTRGFCLCAAEPTVQRLQGMTAQSELARFDSVSVARIPAATSFRADSLVPGVDGWFTGTPGPAATARPSRTFLVVDGTTAPIYTKLRVTQLAGPTAAGPGSVTIEWASQAAPFTAPFGPTRTLTFPVGAQPVYLDLTTGTQVAATGRWQLQFRGWTVRANSGVSGPGVVSIARLDNADFTTLTAPQALAVPRGQFVRDNQVGPFSTNGFIGSPWRYNILGNDNQVWPTYDVYLVRRGTATWKLQFTSYYGPGAQERQVTIRYARLTR
ncbi:MAG: HmuY family protein [Gemmatimonadaceae bacterium]|jgi:hypothetical protein|nr:HmuY family protein [Gemmatimonadaceae bacterium]